MKPKPKNGSKKRVLLWPERRIYHCAGTNTFTQRTPLCKVSFVSSIGKVPIYFEGDAIVLN